jgi:hypothetical protein
MPTDEPRHVDTTTGACASTSDTNSPELHGKPSGESEHSVRPLIHVQSDNFPSHTQLWSGERHRSHPPGARARDTRSGTPMSLTRGQPEGMICPGRHLGLLKS